MFSVCPHSEGLKTQSLIDHYSGSVCIVVTSFCPFCLVYDITQTLIFTQSNTALLYEEREMLSPCRAPECNPGFDRIRASHLLFSVLDHVDYHVSRVICWSCVCLSFLVDDFLVSPAFLLWTTTSFQSFERPPTLYLNLKKNNCHEWTTCFNISWDFRTN
jgi:hypothetical protein